MIAGENTHLDHDVTFSSVDLAVNREEISQG